MGFCIPANDFYRISNMESVTADEFVNEVFEAEGMNPQHYLHLARKVKRKFTDKAGRVYHRRSPGRPAEAQGAD